MTFRWLVALGLGLAGPALGQDEEPAEEATEDVADDVAAWKAALDLPAQAERLRRSGLADEDVKAAMEAARAKGLDARQAREVLEVGRAAVEENGPVENFGTFVQSKLDEGLRGEELAQAIRAEHSARGMGKGSKAPGYKQRGRGGKAKARGKAAKNGKMRARGKAGKNGKMKAKHGKHKAKRGKMQQQGEPLVGEQ